MKKSNEDKLNKHKQNISNAKEKSFEVYLESLREIYKDADNVKRSNLTNRLDTLIFGSSLLAFDYSYAKQIRKEQKMTLKGLAKQIGLTQQAVSNYETGTTTPNPKIKGAKKYLDWLKEEGYNPFGL